MTPLPEIRSYDIGCEPSPSHPAETVLASGWETFLLFNACKITSDPSTNFPTRIDDLGVAVVRCLDCVIFKFGYPNDEGLQEHPLYHLLGDSLTDIVEVIHSGWSEEIRAQQHASYVRIWTRRGQQVTSMAEKDRHFIVPLKEKTFECLAGSMRVERYFANWHEAFEFVQSEFENS